MMNTSLRVILTALICVVALTIAMTMTACRAYSNKEADNDFHIAGEITVASFYADDTTDRLSNIARLFEKKHPETKVNIVTAMQTADKQRKMPGEQEINDYITRTSTEIMTGRGADILSADVLPWIKYADTNQLVDISKLMENDPDFIQDDYEMGVFDAMKYKGGLYSVPINYSFWYVNYNQTIFTEKQAEAAGFGMDKQFTYDELKKLAEQANVPEGAAVFDLLGSYEMFEYLFYSDYYQYIDYENKRASFIDGRFEKLLKQCMDDYKDGAILDHSKYYSDIFDVRKLHESGMEAVSAFDFPWMSDRLRYYFYQLEKRGYGKMSTTSRQKGEDDAIAGMLKTENGKVNVYTYGSYSINALSPNQQLAWEFIKYLLSEDIQTAYVNRLLQPVHKKSYSKVMELRFINILSELNETHAELVDGYMDEYQRMIDIMAPKLNQYVISDRFIQAAVTTECSKFFEGRATAKDVCQALQSRVELYLNE